MINKKNTVGIFMPPDIPESFRVCVENITLHFSEYGIDFYMSDSSMKLQAADVVWDPRAGGGNPPHNVALDLGIPLVVTLHGCAPMVIPKEYVKGNLITKFLHVRKLMKGNVHNQKIWQQVKNKYARVVTVSHYSKSSIIKHLSLDEKKISVVYNGVNHELFHEDGDIYQPLSQHSPYFLHISNDEPRKNVDNIIKAYSLLNKARRWPLVLKLSGNRKSNVSGIYLIQQRLSDKEIAALYRGAGAYVFPSFYEGFGLPIVEAMASGCSVITSNDTACAEVAGPVAELVNSREYKDIARAMEKVMTHKVSAEVKQKAIQRANKFTWYDSSREYAKIFREVIREFRL